MTRPFHTLCQPVTSITYVMYVVVSGYHSFLKLMCCIIQNVQSCMIYLCVFIVHARLFQIFLYNPVFELSESLCVCEVPGASDYVTESIC
jgi:hypothetical protein